MSNDPKVTSLQDIGKLTGVDKVVEASAGRKLDVEAAAEGVATILDEALPEGADGEDGDLKDLRSFKARDFLKGHKEETEAFLRDVAKVEEIFDGLDEMTAALQKLEEINEKKKLRVDTPHIKELRTRIESAKRLLAKVNSEAVRLVRFRHDHEELRSLVDKGHKTFKALRKGEKVDEAVVKELSVGYADFLHDLIREERVVEVDSDQLKRWADKKESFADHAASWFYRDCKVCERGRCRTHWFWGIAGDDQSIQLAKDLRALNNINARIRNHLNPRRPAPTPAKTVATPTTSASVASVPTDEALGATVPDELPSSTES